MDTEHFDSVARTLAAVGPRRQALASLLTAAVCMLTPSSASAKRKKKKKKPSQTKPICQGTQIACAAALGGGCCDADYPQCCEPNRINRGGVCAPAAADCCTANEGGGFCAGAFNRCCPITPAWPYGGCTNLGGTCCPLALGGDICDAPFSTCCRDDFGPYCCGDAENCCAEDTDCGAEETCDFGCCVPETFEFRTGRALRERPRRRGGHSQPDAIDGSARIR